MYVELISSVLKSYGMELSSTSLDRTVLTFKKLASDKLDLLMTLSGWREDVRECIEEIRRTDNISSYHGIKFQLTVRIELKKLIFDEQGESFERIIDPFFNSSCRRYDVDSFDEEVESMLMEIVEKFDTYLENGSGFTLHSIDALYLKVYKYRQLRGGSGLCQTLVNKRACLNIECSDERCFFYSCLAAVYPRKVNANRYQNYTKYLHTLNTDGIHIPVRLQQVRRFERLNPSFSINVLGYDDNRVLVPLYHTMRSAAKYDVNLLLYKNHYYLIRHLSRLFSSQTAAKNRYHFCHYCLLSYRTPLALKDHESLCRNKLQRLQAPKSYDRIEFNRHRSLFFLPFVIYYDIEAILKVDEGDRQVHQPIFV